MTCLDQSLLGRLHHWVFPRLCNHILPNHGPDGLLLFLTQTGLTNHGQEGLLLSIM